MNRTNQRYSCCANISNLRQHLWNMLAASLRRRQSQTRRLRNGQNLLQCKGFLQLQTGENRSKNTPSLLSMVLHKIQGTGLCSCGLLCCSTVRLLSRNRISSQWTRHYSFWQPLFLVFLCIFLGIRTQTYRNPTSFLFRKVSTHTLATQVPFLPFSSGLLGF